MTELESTGATPERRLALQDEIDAIVSEIEERRAELRRSRLVTIGTIVFVAPLMWAADFPGRPDVVVMVVITLLVAYVGFSAAYAEMTSLAFFTSAKQRLDALTGTGRPDEDTT